MTDCYCTYEFPEFYQAKRPISCKEYHCDECGHQIRPGDRYERVFMISDGCRSTWKTCVYCLAIRDLVESRVRCLCWCHGNMLDDVHEEIEHNGHNMPGLAFAVGRLMVEEKRSE